MSKTLEPLLMSVLLTVMALLATDCFVRGGV